MALLADGFLFVIPDANCFLRPSGVNRQVRRCKRKRSEAALERDLDFRRGEPDSAGRAALESPGEPVSELVHRILQPHPQQKWVAHV